MPRALRKGRAIFAAAGSAVCLNPRYPSFGGIERRRRVGRIGCTQDRAGVRHVDPLPTRTDLRRGGGLCSAVQL